MDSIRLEVKYLGRMDYREALEIQEDLLVKRQNHKVGDSLLLVEHPPVITLGRRGRRENIVIPDHQLERQGVSVYEVSRGGDVTYHGPGQIVGYPIVHLENHHKDIKRFVWNIEEIFIRLLADKYGIRAHREDKKYTGVWVGREKITAIGIAVKRWVTMHGFAFNVNTDLEHFKWITPCGITDRGITSLEKLSGGRIDFECTLGQVADYFKSIFGYGE